MGKKLSLVAVVAGLLACGLFGTRVEAAQISGAIDFGGVVTFDQTSLLNATRVNLWNNSFVLQDSGDFATFAAAGTHVNMAAPWILAPSTPTPSLWNVGGFTLDLTS